MAKILCITSGMTGLLYASFEVVNRLLKEGHQVVYGCPHDVKEQVEKQGFEYRQLPPVNFNPTPDLPPFSGRLSRIRRISYRFLNIQQRKKQGIEALNGPAIKEALIHDRPDLILIDMELHDYIITAVALNIPIAILSPWFSQWKRPGMPPLTKDIIPGKNWRGSRAALEIVWTKERFKRWKAQKLLAIRTGFADRKSVLIAYAKSLNFPVGILEHHYWVRPFTYDKLPVLSMTLRELEFPHKQRKDLYYVGPMVHLSRVEQKIPDEDRISLNKLYALRKNNGKRLIYCSVTTVSRADHKFLKKLSEAVSQNPEWILIISLGGKTNKDDILPLPENVFAFDWTPQLEIIANADLSINHGGINTIHECILFRVPMLVCSGKRNDQNGCAARITYHRLGLMADKDIVTAKGLSTMIEAILSDPAYKEKMSETYELYHQYQADKRLEKVVKELI